MTNALQEQASITTLTATQSDTNDVVNVAAAAKSFGKFEAVKGISFTIKRGETFGLLGPNGAGKSTTINMISSYLRPSSGHVTVLGMDTVKQADDIKERIGVVPQELALYEELTAEENLTFFGQMYQLERKALQVRAAELLNLMGLYDRRSEPVKHYSGGMKRRLNIAVGLINNPDLLLLDEPTVGVDPQSRNAIFDNIEQLKARGLTLLYTTHYMEEAERLCDRIAIVDNGKLIAIGTLEQLLALRDQSEIVVQKPRGLEELFLQLTGKTLRE